MLHKISQMCDKVNVMYTKSMNLRRLKYDIPKENRTKEEEHHINELVQDIQALAMDIANDRQPYDKKKEIFGSFTV